MSLGIFRGVKCLSAPSLSKMIKGVLCFNFKYDFPSIIGCKESFLSLEQSSSDQRLILKCVVCCHEARASNYNGGLCDSNGVFAVFVLRRNSGGLCFVVPVSCRLKIWLDASEISKVVL